MAEELIHARAQAELSAAHDEGRRIDPASAAHIDTCDRCSRFQADLGLLDELLGAGRYEEVPDQVEAVLEGIPKRRIGWLAIAAITMVGVTVGALVGGIATRIDQVQAEELSALFHRASPELKGLSANLIVVERGWHPDVPERVYTGSLDYLAPESLAIRLVDTTTYPTTDWVHNDIELTVADGNLVSVASPRCPVQALPSCLVPPMTNAVAGLKPFDDGILSPLELVGPGRSLNWWSGLEVIGTPVLGDGPTIQVATTVAAVELIRAITDAGSWRELHPTDPVLMWLDEKTLTPLRIEVMAADSAERALWQLRRGYDDQPSGEPIMIVSVDPVPGQPRPITVDLPPNTVSGGFVDGPVDLPEPVLPEGFTAHRSGHWTLPEGGRVEVASWSDGRSWLMVQVTDSWDQPRLLGSALPFARPVDLGASDIGYLGPSGDSVALHTDQSDALVRGSLSSDDLIAAASSLGLGGVQVPDHWPESAVMDVGQMPAGTLIPTTEGWSLAGTVDGSNRVILMTGAGDRTVLVTQRRGDRLDPPIGADFLAVDVRGVTGRYDAAASALEWVEAGMVFRMRSDTVGMGEIVAIAEAMVGS